jgi:long-chain acyl-CoA synthetase
MLESMNLAAAFCASAEQHSAKPAIFWGADEFTYGDLLRRTRALAAHLQQQFNVRPGDRVGIWLKNCPEFVPVLFGILQAGGVAVPINNFLKPDEVSFIVGDAGANVLITDQSTAEALPKLSAARPGLKFWRVEEFGSLPDSALSGSQREASEGDLAVIIYTSGTTGHPKGAMLSHGNLLSNVESCRQVLLAVEADRFVVLLPMFHSFMLTVGVLLPLLVGGSLVLVRSLHPPKNVVMEILQHRATLLPAIPQFFRALANAPVPKDQLPLRLCVSGGAPLPAEILREFNEKMPIPLIEGYGLSEASPVVSLNPVKGPWKAGSIGVPIPGVEVTVQDDTGRKLGRGETGEICVRGPNVMQGYWNQPAETAKALRDGWLLTGDIGHEDEDGYFYITDRKKDMLLVNGINVYPREIEEVLYQFAGVREAAVIGVPDARRGEQPIAFVAANEGITLEEKALQQFVRDKLADYKVPKKVVFLPALPRNATGKILKTALRQQAQGMS